MTDAQVESGVKITSAISLPTFVFSSLWPSWMFAARAAGYKDIVTCIEDEKPRVNEVVGAIAGDGCCVVNLAEWKIRLQEYVQHSEHACVLILLQGPRDAINRILEFLISLGKCGEKLEILAFPTVEVKKRRPSKKRRKLMTSMGVIPIISLSHQMVGGVVDGSWTLESNLHQLGNYRSDLEKASAVVAHLSDYLSHTQNGVTIPVPTGEGTYETERAVWKKRKMRVVARSIYATTGWVKRSLTLDEFMDAYDIGVGDRKKMKGALLKENLQFPMEFTQQIPVRVLLRCLEVLATTRRAIDREHWDEVPESGDEYANMGVEGLEENLLGQLQRDMEVAKPASGISEDKKLQAKNDDATAQVTHWNARVCERLKINYRPEVHDRALDRIRDFQLRWYKSYRGGVILSFRRYMKMEYGCDWMAKLHRNKGMVKTHASKLDNELARDYLVGIDAITRALGSSFWEWDDGSTVFFWRWSREHWKELRDGLKVWFRRADLPKYWGRQRWPQGRLQRTQLMEKIEKVVNRRYISPGFAKSLTSFFAVPKGVGDIRVVYDATKSGLNDAIWTPTFFLPTIRSVLQDANEETFYGDIDIGEMFLNYFLDPALRPWAGVDVTELVTPINLLGRGSENRTIMRWERSLMGVRSSPFNCVRAYLISEEILMGDRRSVHNPFRWDRVVLNLPGSKSYDPSKPWVYRFDEIGKAMASFVLSYVDDLRTGSNKGRRDCENVTHAAGSKLNYLGEQDASRKRGEASQEPDAWAGSVIMSKQEEGLFVTVLQEKWNKVKDILSNYLVLILESEKQKQELWVEYKRLEKDTGFLVHVCMTYEHLKPYLKGFYLTMNSWRYDREVDGWKKAKKDWEELAEEYWEDCRLWSEAMEETRREAPSALPEKVRCVARFVNDVRFLAAAFNS